MLELIPVVIDFQVTLGSTPGPSGCATTARYWVFAEAEEKLPEILVRSMNSSCAVSTCRRVMLRLPTLVIGRYVRRPQADCSGKEDHPGCIVLECDDDYDSARQAINLGQI